MNRIRLVFAALAVLLWIPMAVLVQNALESVALGREVRHETLAERVFDEMERQLGELTLRESGRAFGEYQFYLDGGPHALRSPLSYPPAESYVVGYFEIDPDGGFTTPRVPADPAAARARGDWPSPDGPDRRVDEWKPIALRGIRSKKEWVAKQSVAEPSAVSGAATRADAHLAAESAAPAEKTSPAKGTAVDPYQRAVRSLNRAAERQAQLKRKQIRFEPKRAEPESARLAAAPKLPESIAADDAERVRADRSNGQGRSFDALESEARAPVASALADAARDSDAVSEREAVARRMGQQMVEIDSMVGHWVDEHYVVLHRAATLGGRRVRQGLVVDVRELGEWLRSGVLRGSPLEGAALSLGAAEASLGARPVAAAGARYSYRHRFSEPFDEVSAALSLPLLADAGGPGYLYAFSALLLIAGTLGLLALYRMVAVNVTFAQRRNDFVAAVSHELKTPLTTIRMYAEMLRDDMVPTRDKRQEYYETITAESERLTRLINNVLEFSRIEQGTREMSLVAGAIGPVIREAVALLEPHAREQGFEIAVDIEADLPPVRFDRDALLQVVFNLVDNALKYARASDDRTIRLDVRRGGEGVVLAVRDRGPGVAAGHLPKIFEPFYRGERELTRTAKGTGIGLALVKGLCERMGAVVTGRNAKGGGFEVLLTFRPD